MRILYFSQLFYPALFGGGEYIFYQWAKELARKGHDISIITQRIKGTASYEVVDGIKVWRVGKELDLGGSLPTGVTANLLFIISAFLKGIQLCRSNKPEIIHSNTYMPVFPAQLCATIMRIPHIVTVHDVYYISENEFWKTWSSQQGISRGTGFLGPTVERMIARMPATLFHTVSNASMVDLQKLGTKKIVIIPNGIDASQYPTEDAETGCNEVVFVGRLVFYKNIDILFKAFEKVIPVIPHAKLVIVGDGPMKDALIEKASSLGNHVQFAGRVSHQEKCRLISKAVALLNPSLVEGFGIVLLEAYVCGRPVIVSRIQPLSDLVDDQVDGFTVSPTDPDEWANKIISLMQNPDAANRMGKIGRQKVLSKYSISKVVENLVHLYDEVRGKRTH